MKDNDVKIASPTDKGCSSGGTSLAEERDCRMNPHKGGDDVPEGRKYYADIIDLPHHKSATRPHMSLYRRAAQFAPFAALSGYSEMVDEKMKAL